jgi:S1-C subfamily serine protease
LYDVVRNTVSDGIISAWRIARDLDLNLTPDLQVFQVTAPLSPRSSGGPLLNMNGEVIGITSFGRWNWPKPEFRNSRELREAIARGQ